MREPLSDSPRALKRTPHFAATLIDEEIVSWSAYDDEAETDALCHLDALALESLGCALDEE